MSMEELGALLLVAQSIMRGYAPCARRWAWDNAPETQGVPESWKDIAWSLAGFGD